jgi:vitamin B12/bleomycin/antimicrobial peptide transport system ATP-binding/permease protein
LFLDEATSALDEYTERAPYAVAQARLPGTTVVSVAHRPGVAAFHRRRLTLHPETRSIENELVRTAIG